MVENRKINVNLIKSFCTIVPDANVILHFIFEEGPFKLKINFFLSFVSEYEIRCEILPGVSKNLNRRLINAIKRYYIICRLIKEWIREKVGDPSKITPSKESLGFFEKAFSDIFSEAVSRSLEIKPDDIRIVEDTLVNLLYELIDKNQAEVSLEDFFKTVEIELYRKYKDFADRQSIFMREINAFPIAQENLLPTTAYLEKILKEKCGVKDPEDLSQLEEAISMMYKDNRWYGFVSMDYTHIINKRYDIEKYTQLVVSDPLYVLYHLDQVVNESLHPRESALKKNIPFDQFIRFPSQPRIV